jgi:acyl-CoA reductase-like NAD-dependent aldehyde dehydrogenase
VHAFIEAGKKDAALVTGGYRYNKGGFYIPPTLFIDPNEDAQV